MDAEMQTAPEHWSDCGVYYEPPRACTCGGLNLAGNRLELANVALVASTGRIGCFIKLMDGEGFIEEQHLPASALARIAASADLIDVHGLVAILEDANSMNLNDARPAIISKLKALAIAEGAAGGRGQHWRRPIDENVSPNLPDSHGARK